VRRRALALWWGILLGVALVAVGFAAATQPSAATPQARIATLEREVRCLSCGELDVAQSKSAGAYSIAAYIRREVDQGASNQQILDSLVATYGDGVLMAPPTSGLSLFLWLLPVAVAAGLGYEVVRGLRRGGAAPEALSGGRLGAEPGAMDAERAVAPQLVGATSNGRLSAASAAPRASEEASRASGPEPSVPPRPRQIVVPRWAALAGGALMVGSLGLGAGLWIAGMHRGGGAATESLASELRLGETLAALGAAGPAERAFDAALQVAPANPVALAYEGWLRFNTAHTTAVRTQALAMLDEAARLGPQVPQAQLFDAFGLYYGRHNLAGALARLASYLADHPSATFSREAAPVAAPIYAAAHQPLPAVFRG